MRKQRILTFLGLGVVGVSAFAFYAFQGQILNNSPEFGKQVVVAAKTIPVGTVLTKEAVQQNFQYLKVPKNYLVNGAIDDPQQLVGKKTLATLDVNQQVTNDVLSDHAVRLGTNDRLYSFPIDYARSVGGDVFANDLVDIEVYYPKTGQTQTLITGIPVYRVQDSNGVEITRTTMVNTQNGPAHVQPALITIAATPDMIQVLQQAQNGGQLFLVKYANENMPQ